MPKVKYNREWILTDVGSRQYGRQISEQIFEFKENGIEARIIDLAEYSKEEIERAINVYGYTLDPKNRDFCYIVSEYPGEDVLQNYRWIIAECLFELDL